MEELGGGKRMFGKYEEVLEESKGSKGSKGSKVQGSQGPRYLKLTVKYELDSKEGPSCFDKRHHFVPVIMCKRRLEKFSIILIGLQI